MPDVTIKRFEEAERYSGPYQRGQEFYFTGKSLGLSKLGVNGIRMPPKWEHYPEHDRAEDNEEELYIPLEGSGTLTAEGRTFPMQRGVLIRVGPTTKRKVVPGAEGMTLLVVSDQPNHEQPSESTGEDGHQTRHWGMILGIRGRYRSASRLSVRNCRRLSGKRESSQRTVVATSVATWSCVSFRQ